MSAFFAAVRLLTVIPIPGDRGADARSIASSPVLFPVVGLAIGLALGATDYGLTRVLPDGVSAAIVIALAIAITGALHLDGLADTTDALFGGRTPVRRLEIMRDPAIGTFGAAAIGSTMLIRWAAIAALASPTRIPAIIAAPLIGRTAALLLVKAFPYARANGLGEGYTAVPLIGAIAAHVFTAAIAFVLLGPWALFLFAATLALTYAFAVYTSRRLGGGLTGDVYGAASEIAEVIALVAATALVESGANPAPIWN